MGVMGNLSDRRQCVQMCWNLTAEEAELLFLDITRPQHVAPGSAKAGKQEPEPPATHVTKEQYLLGACSVFCK
jgi:transcriptional regulator of nitric oxide reductase